MKYLAAIATALAISSGAAHADCGLILPATPVPCPAPGAGPTVNTMGAATVGVYAFFAIQALRMKGDVDRIGYVTRCTASGVGCGGPEGDKPALGFGYELGKRR